MQFQSYGHIDNHYNTEKEYGDPTSHLYTDENFKWVAMEKIHGCNFSLITNGIDVITGRRNGILLPDDNFNNHNEIKNKYSSSAISIFNYIKETINPSISQIQIYGELFGGSYNNITSKTHKMIQGGMNYHPEHEFMFFDVRIFEDEKTSYLDKAVLIEMVKTIDLKFKLAPIIKIDNLTEIMKLNPKIETLVPAEYGLPHMDNNFGEGFVVHPLYERNTTHRTIFKFKNPNFAEITKGTKTITKGEKYSDIVKNKFVNKNRYDNVVSKMLDTEKTEENIINKMIEDVEQEIIDGQEMEINVKGIRGAVTGFIKRMGK